MPQYAIVWAVKDSRVIEANSPAEALTQFVKGREADVFALDKFRVLEVTGPEWELTFTSVPADADA